MKITDKIRLDWLEKENARFNQAAIIMKHSDDSLEGPYSCSSGFHRGGSIREAIDAAILAGKKKI